MKRHILVVDDDEMILDIIKESLENAGYEITTANNPHLAKELFLKHDYSLILTDLNMPGMNGIEFSKYLFENYQKVPPIVIMTGYGSIETVLEAMKLGIKDYILKPFKIQSLVNTIENVLKRAALEKEVLELREIIKIYSASEELNNTLNQQEVGSIFVRNIQEIANVDAVLLYINDDFNILKTSSEYFCVRKKYKDKEYTLFSNIPKKLYLSNILKLFPNNKQSLIVKKEVLNSFNIDFETGCFYLLKAGQRVTGLIMMFNNNEEDSINEEKLLLLKIIFDEGAIALENAYLYKKNQEMFFRTWQTLAMTIDAKDKYTHFHSTNVSKYSKIIGSKIGLGKEDMETLVFGALLHDIGKIGIAENILNKPSRLTKEEFEIIKQHPIIGKTILNPIKELFPNIVDIVYYHHERYDGKGYPEGIPAKELPITVRIVSLADALDAMSSDRSYRRKLDFKTVFSEIKNNSGTQFDPEVVKAFYDALPEIKAVLKS